MNYKCYANQRRVITFKQKFNYKREAKKNMYEKFSIHFYIAYPKLGLFNKKKVDKV